MKSRNRQSSRSESVDINSFAQLDDPPVFLSSCIHCPAPAAFGAYCIDHAPDSPEDGLSVLEAAYKLRDARRRLDQAAASGLRERDTYGFAQLRAQEGMAGRALDRAVDAHRGTPE